MPTPNATARAMLMMIVAMLALPGIDAIAKWLAGSISSGQVTWSRFFFQIIFMSPLLLRTRGPWLTPALWLHAARGAMIAFATLFFFSGLAVLPMADAIAIFFIEPLLVTLLSAPVFRGSHSLAPYFGDQSRPCRGPDHYQTYLFRSRLRRTLPGRSGLLFLVLHFTDAQTGE